MEISSSITIHSLCPNRGSATIVQKPVYDAGFTYLLGGANSNAKTAKGIPLFPEIEAAIQYLAPDNSADGLHTVCPWSTCGCRAACLNTSGRGQVTGPLTLENLRKYAIHRARINRTLLYLSDPTRFIDMLSDELRRLQNRADRLEKSAVARLNGMSDIPWESVAPVIFNTFPRIQFYDYTKGLVRAERWLAGKLPTNYHLTYSFHEKTSNNTVTRLVAEGCNVAVVFRKFLPTRFLGLSVLDGNLHDFRHKDPKGKIVGLTEKARAKEDETGFVVEVADARRRN